MKLIDGWRAELNRLWTVRIALFTALLSVADQLLPAIGDYLPRWVYAGLSVAVVVSRILQQKPAA